MPFWSRSRQPVRAAGVLLFRDGRVLLIHRPSRDDWSFPKGKHEPGESDEQCALRELEEEVGLRVRLGERVGETRYRLAGGRPKQVAWFRGEADGEPQALDNVDEVRWATPVEADELLSYDRDRELLASALAAD
jgi:8-oxo-dGTP pyrophosphatase MutT (NUDIX family)